MQPTEPVRSTPATSGAPAASAWAAPAAEAIGAIGASNEIGGLESGLTAAWLGPVRSVVLGGVGTVLTVVMTALLAPQLRRYGPLQPHHDEAPVPAPATPAPATAAQ